MTLQQAIEKAKQGGYILPAPCEIEGIEVYHKGDTLLDSLFWQALGKSMGWGEDAQLKYYGEDEDESMLGGVLWFPWEEKWHALIDHLASGKSIEDYFQSLS